MNVYFEVKKLTKNYKKIKIRLDRSDIIWVM
jgi:hypothetical protein